jgi:hypothetical protein
MYIYFENETAANLWIDQVNIELGYPNEETHTTTYTAIINNLDENRVDVICPIDDNAPEDLIVDAQIHDKTWAIENGFIKTPEV